MHTETNYKNIVKKLYKIPDYILGKEYQIVNRYVPEVIYGTIVYYNSSWAEVQIGNDFKIFSFTNYKFNISQ